MDNTSILSHTDQQLRRLPGARKLGLTYALWAFGISLGLQLVIYIADRMTANTGGLGGIGLRSALQTVQVLAGYLNMLALPFLQLGHQAAGLNTARGQDSHSAVLLQGFRRFGPVLRLAVAWTLLLFGLFMAVSNAAATIYMLLPGSMEILPQLESVLADPNALTDAAAIALMGKMWPMYAILGVLLLLLLVPLSYRLRLAVPAILDGENRVIRTMFTSFRSMRGACRQLFLLDLRFWVYYLLTAIAAVVAYGDQIVGISGDVAYWVSYLLSLGIQLLATVLYLPRLHTAQAQFYLTHYQPMDN